VSEVGANTVDLLTPTDYFRNNYVHQIRQTIDAYSPSKVVLQPFPWGLNQLASSGDAGIFPGSTTQDR
jgi:hypothetical protein